MISFPKRYVCLCVIIFNEILQIIQVNFPFPVAIASQYWHRNTLACDDVIAVTTSAFEAESIKAARGWFDSMGKDSFVVGPLEDVPASMATTNGSAVTKNKPVSQDDAQILEFLDDMHAKHGPNSVIYVRKLVGSIISY
jgi:hypothetical protein